MKNARCGDLLERDLCDEILAAAVLVHRELGSGFLELVYHAALATIFNEKGLVGEQNARIPVRFHGSLIATFKPDFVVNGRVIVELKAVKLLPPDAEAQLLNYLRASPIEVGLLLNFGPTLGIKRFVYGNARKVTPSS